MLLNITAVTNVTKNNFLLEGCTVLLTRRKGADRHSQASINMNMDIDTTSVCPIVRTSRTAFVCASDYDDRTQFHMFEQKNEHGKNSIQRNSLTFGSPPCQKI